MKRGKKICGELKKIRRRIADENGIELDIPECTYEGDCRGTCPRCEWEVKYLEQSLFERLKLGKIATISGIAIGLSACAGACGPVIQTTGKMTNDHETSFSESIPEPAPVDDTLLKMTDVGVNFEKPTQDTLNPIKNDVEKSGTKEDDDVIFGAIQREYPEFPGGEEAMYEFLANNIRYPQAARDSNIQGKVFVQFVVEKDGTITNPKVLRDICSGCGEEALRVVRMMPKWKPGILRGEAVRVQYTLPVIFQVE